MPKAPKSQSSLWKFLTVPGNSHARESILNHRMLYDLKLAAAARGYHLEVYTSDVDHEGFDIILDDGDLLKKIQVKTVTGATASWAIHKRLLRPEVRFIEGLGFESSPEGEGVQGGVILMEIVPDGDGIQVNYFYTDVFLLTALRLGVISNPSDKNQTVIKRVFKDLSRGTSHQKISVTKTCFLGAKGPAELLALAGFHNQISTTAWRHQVFELALADLNGKPPESGTPSDVLKESAATELQLLASPAVTFFKRPAKK